MKTIIVAINAKYDHENLAAWYLKAACLKSQVDVTVLKYSINDSHQKIWSEIMDEEPDGVLFTISGTALSGPHIGHKRSGLRP